jgi:flagellar biosynthetic protein FlhB
MMTEKTACLYKTEKTEKDENLIRSKGCSRIIFDSLCCSGSSTSSEIASLFEKTSLFKKTSLFERRFSNEKASTEKALTEKASYKKMSDEKASDEKASYKKRSDKKSSESEKMFAAGNISSSGNISVLSLEKVSALSEIMFSGIPLDLQRFAEDSPTGARTEPATDKRRRDARQKGQVAKSMDIVTALVLICGFCSLYGFRTYINNEISNILTFSFRQMPYMEFDLAQMPMILKFYITSFFKAIAPLWIGIMAGAFFGNLFQIGFLFTTETLKFNIEKLNPIAGVKRIFAMRSIVELLKSLLKLAAVSYLPYQEIRARFGDFYNMIPQDINVVSTNIGWLIFKISIQIGTVLFILALLDYGYQKYDYEENLKMSKYDVKKERKEQEGDPMIKSKIRQLQMEYAMQDLMKAVPESDVVITNPTHISVALKYDRQAGNSAPVIMAMGADFMAARIREIARDYEVPLHEDKPLARKLYADCKVGDMIPEDLFTAVVEVYKYLHKTSEKVRAKLEDRDG